MKKQNKLLIKIQRLLKKLNQREYLHHFGPKKYKLKEHLFALLFMQIAKLSFRRVSFLLIELGFYVPSYSALCKSRKRISPLLFEKLLNITIDSESENVAIDSTGFSCRNPSFHYMKRINGKPIKNFVKLSAFFDIDNRKFIALKIRTRRRHDVLDFPFLLKQSPKFRNLFGDSAYDSEKIHKKCFERKIQTFIKPKKNVKRGFYRRKQMKNYSEERYHQRSLAETGFSCLKRKYSGFILTKSKQSAIAEISLRAIAHNLNLVSS